METGNRINYVRLFAAGSTVLGGVPGVVWGKILVGEFSDTGVCISVAIKAELLVSERCLSFKHDLGKIGGEHGVR